MKKNRILYLDVLRSIAILLVVLCHSIESAYPNLYGLSFQSQFFKIVLFTFSRLGVPIFLFLTGALVLKKDFNNDEDVKKFYKHNLLPLIITYEIWVVIYNLFNLIMYNNFVAKDFLYEILFLKNCSNMIHIWYMPTIIGIYLVLPFISKIINVFSKKLLSYFLILSIFANFFVPSINILSQIFNFDGIAFVLDFYFLGSCYGIYVIIGYYLDNGLLKNFKSYQLILMFLLFFSFTIFVQWYSMDKAFTYMVWYNFVTVLPCGMCIYEIIKRKFVFKSYTHKIFKKIVSEISKISSAIYYLHLPFILIFNKYISINCSKPFLTIIIFVFSMISSVLFIEIFSNVKVIKKYVFFIK